MNPVSSPELPEAFIAQMQELLPDYTAFADALAQPASVAVRLNPFKTRPLAQISLPWCPLGYALPERPIFALDPRWHAGAYYVQDASCMLLEAVLTQLNLQPQLILDACAAPGGKATHLATLYPEALVLANEVIKSRAAILAENVAKWGCPNMAVSRLDPAAFAALPDSFDLVLADVPCSGEGLFRKDTAARNEWSLAQVALCASRQRRILSELWECLKPEGILIYSTCTFNCHENEEQLAWMQAELGAEAVDWTLPASWPIVQQTGCLRCYPHQAGGEGFFLTVLRKPEGRQARPRQTARLETLPARESQRLQDWLTGDYDYGYGSQGDTLLAWPRRYQQPLQQLSQLRNVRFGTPLAEIKGKQGKDLRPSAELALANGLNRAAFASLHLDLEQVTRYLQGEAIYDLPPGTDGHTLVCFEGWPLGWAKRVEQRANNLFPQAWRLRMKPQPDKIHQAWELLQTLLPLQPQ